MRGIKNIFWFLWGLALSAIVAAVLQVTPASAQSAAQPAARARAGTPQPAEPDFVPSATRAPPSLRGSIPSWRNSRTRAESEGETKAEIEDGETGATPAEPTSGEPGSGEPDAPLPDTPGVRPTVQDGDPAVGIPEAEDGIAQVGEPQMTPDGLDPTKYDTRPADEAAAFDARTAAEATAFENPPSPFDPLLFQIEDINPILDRRPARLARFEPYDPVGIKAGGFVVFPEVEIAALATSNAQLSPQARADTAVEARPSVRVVSNWQRHAVEVRASGNFSGYSEYSSENNTGYHLETRGRLDITRRTNVQLELSRDVAQESRQVLEAAKTGPRADVTIDELRGSANHRFNRLSLQLRGSVADISYSAVESGGVLNSNADRNYTHATEAVRATWEFKPTLLGFGEVGLDQRGYTQNAFSDGISRSSKGERYRVGISFGNTGAVLRGEASLGWGKQTPDDSRLPDVSGVLIDANVAWKVTGLTSLIFSARSEFADTNIAGSSGAVSRQGGVEARHRLRHDVVASAGVSYTVTDYTGVSIEERDLRGTLGLEYFLNRETVLFGRYQHTAFDTTSPTGDYNSDEVRLGVRLRR